MLTTHVVSQDLAEELREAGWPQEGSTFYRVKVHPYSLVLPGPSWEIMYHGQLVDYKEGEYLFAAAPLASELGEVLPDSVHSGGVSACLTIQKTAGNFWTAEYVEPDGSVLHESAGAWLPDALAALWLHLNKEGLLK